MSSASKARPALASGERIMIGEKYGYAMEVTDPSEAASYFEACVQHNVSFGNSREEAERIERANIGYFAGYYDHDTRLRVEKLFDCAHPIFGKASNRPVEPARALAAGLRLAR